MDWRVLDFGSKSQSQSFHRCCSVSLLCGSAAEVQKIHANPRSNEAVVKAITTQKVVETNIMIQDPKARSKTGATETNKRGNYSSKIRWKNFKEEKQHAKLESTTPAEHHHPRTSNTR